MSENSPGNEFAVIFDMDGVLVDTVGLNWQAYNSILEEQYGCRVVNEEIYRYLGRSLEDQVGLLNHDFGIDIDLALFTQRSDLLKRKLFETLHPKDGVEGLLGALDKADIPVAVGTSSPYSVMRHRLSKAGILSYFSICTTEEDVRAHKPDPEVYLVTAERLGIRPERCVVVEDAPSGVESAKRAGMKCVGIITPHVRREDLQGIDLIVESVGRLSVKNLQALVDAAPGSVV